MKHALEHGIEFGGLLGCAEFVQLIEMLDGEHFLTRVQGANLHGYHMQFRGVGFVARDLHHHVVLQILDLLHDIPRVSSKYGTEGIKLG